MHAGFMTDIGGEVRFMHVQGSNHYLGASKNGVISVEELGEEAPRGFKFVGD